MEMAGNACEICGEPATTSVADVEEHFRARSFCERHAREMGYVNSDSNSGWLMNYVRFLRAFVEFAKEKKRIPSQEDMQALGFTGVAIREGASGGTLEVKTAYMDALADFVEVNGRLPEPNEIAPDPF